ncbi:MAG TPA: carboxypeptidase-like regulatory domain-containing protein [Verrucomicrobiae bacterium]|nr:carboxypeptidase-like regulatory domain-containing protein [Verrucomicrobiae bacterium]
MKATLLKILAASAAVAITTQIHAATLTVSPSVTSNTYTGVITLNITGLTNTEKVVVQKFLDLNGNGSVDAGEPMIDAFKIADGGAMIIGGVTNLNVPFDRNPAPGAITTTLNFAPVLILESVVGQQIITVVSPTGRFAPVTATFQVTNAALAQNISGRVYSNGVPEPYAVVVAQDQQISNPVGATVADASGYYFLALPPGNYTPISVNPNCIYNFSSAPTMTLSNGLSATNDLFVTNGTTIISGTVYDSANSNGLGGVMLTLQSNSRFAIAFTDSNGNYSAAVTPNFWKIQPSKERLARRAYVLPQATFQVDATAGDVTGADIALPKGNALFYGRITDNSNAPLANIELSAGTGNNVNNSYAAKGYSDANGYYTVAVLGDGTNYWSCNANDSKNAALLSYIVNFSDTVVFTNNSTALADFIALPTDATISGNVQDNSGTNVVGVTLQASASINGLNYQATESTTDNSGNYLLGVADGQWHIEFLNGGFSDNLDTAGYEDITGPHYVTVPPTNAVLNITVYPIGTPFVTDLQRFSSTQFGFTLNGATNVNYTVQYATDLVLSNWADLFSLTLTTNNYPVVDINATNGARFYRVRKN